MNIIKVKLLHPDARIPTYATDGSGAFDFYTPEAHTLMAGQTCVIPLGIAIEIPTDHTLLIFSRSGHGFKNDMRLSNCTAVIDSDYRGEIKIKLKSDQHSSYSMNEFNVGDRVAQGILFHTPQVSFEVVNELSETERGNSGFGSTG